MHPSTDAPNHAEPDAPGRDVTAEVALARRGLRRDVEALIRALEAATLIVPLARKIDGAQVGVTEEVGAELSLSPHLLFDEARTGYLPIFTRADLVLRATDRVGWTTDDGPLEFCSLPAAVVLELGVSITDDARVAGVIVNPFDDSELLLRRHEVVSIARGRALPLVGYVEDIPLGDEEERIVAEMDGAPPEAVTSVIERVLEGAPGTAGYSLHRTFNAERDLEPHLTLNVLLEDDDLDRGALARTLGSALDGTLPPPGYIDIVFNDPTLR